jgi:hypothetical protein
MLLVVCGACKKQSPFRRTHGPSVAGLPVGWSVVEWAQPLPDEPSFDVNALALGAMSGMFGEAHPEVAHSMGQSARALQAISEKAKRQHMGQMIEIRQMYLCVQCTQKIPGGDSEVISHASVPLPDEPTDPPSVLGFIPG